MSAFVSRTAAARRASLAAMLASAAGPRRRVNRSLTLANPALAFRTAQSLAFLAPDFDLAPDLLADADDLVGDPVDGLEDRLGEGLEERLDLVGDAADAEDRGEGADQHRDALGQRVLDQGGNAAGATGGDGDHRVEHRVDELDDLGAARHDERDDVDDHLAGLDERRRRVEQRDDPGDPGREDRRDQVFGDLGEQVLLQVADPLLDVLPDLADAFRAKLGDEGQRALGRLDRLRGHSARHHPGLDRVPGEARASRRSS